MPTTSDLPAEVALLRELVPGGRLTWTDNNNSLLLVLDRGGFEFFIEASPECEPVVLGQLVRTLEANGYQLLDEDECEPECSSIGWTRIYLVPVEPGVEIEGDDEDRRWGHGGLAGLAVSVGAIMLSTPAITSLLNHAMEVAA